jgi:pimeloyl-ACP methyl ester carboxylesterase
LTQRCVRWCSSSRPSTPSGTRQLLRRLRGDRAAGLAFLRFVFDPVLGNATERVARALPNAELRTAIGVGHLPQLDRPGLLVDAVAAAF